MRKPSTELPPGNLCSVSNSHTNLYCTTTRKIYDVSCHLCWYLVRVNIRRNWRHQRYNCISWMLHTRADRQLLFVMVMRKRMKLKMYSYSVHAAKACKGSGGVVPLILYLSARGRWMVTVTSLPLYPWEITPVIMKCGAQWASDSECFAEQKNF